MTTIYFYCAINWKYFHLWDLNFKINGDAIQIVSLITEKPCWHEHGKEFRSVTEIEERNRKINSNTFDERTWKYLKYYYRQYVTFQRKCLMNRYLLHIFNLFSRERKQQPLFLCEFVSKKFLLKPVKNAKMTIKYFFVKETFSRL